jgi:hypothetical protein
MHNQYVMPYNLLREHAAAILVYTALSGEKKKQAIIAAGAAPVLVRVLQVILALILTVLLLQRFFSPSQFCWHEN